MINQPKTLSHCAGSFVVVDGSGKEKALESGCKVAYLVSQVLFYEQVRALKKSPEWCALVSDFDFYSFICTRSTCCIIG